MILLCLLSFCALVSARPRGSKPLSPSKSCICCNSGQSVRGQAIRCWSFFFLRVFCTRVQYGRGSVILVIVLLFLFIRPFSLYRGANLPLSEILKDVSQPFALFSFIPQLAFPSIALVDHAPVLLLLSPKHSCTSTAAVEISSNGRH